jgi:hypothetical protein
MVVRLHHRKWLLVIDRAKGGFFPWLPVGCISICDSAALKASPLQASTMGGRGVGLALAFT